MLQTADGAALAEIGEMLQRMRETCGTITRSGTLTTADDISNLDQEYTAAGTQKLTELATDTTFNNTAIIGGGQLVQIENSSRS